MIFMLEIYASMPRSASPRLASRDAFAASQHARVSRVAHLSRIFGLSPVVHFDTPAFSQKTHNSPSKL
jgi:hypothetical protein